MPTSVFQRILPSWGWMASTNCCGWPWFCCGFCWLLAAMKSLPSASSGGPTRSERGVVGQVGRLPDDLAVVGPPAGQLERGHQILVLEVAAQRPDVIARGDDREPARVEHLAASAAWPAPRGCGTTRCARAACRLQVQGQDVAQVVDEERRPVDGHGRHGEAQRVGLPLVELQRRHAGFDRVGEPQLPGRVDRRGRGRAPAGRRARPTRGRGGLLVLGEQAAEQLGGGPVSAARASPSRRGSDPPARRGPARIRTDAPRGRAPGRLSGQASAGERSVSGRSRSTDSQQSAARSNRAELEVEVAQPIGGVVADRRDEIRRIDPLEVLQLGRALGLVEQLLGLGVVEQAGRPPGRPAAAPRGSSRRFRSTGMMKPFSPSTNRSAWSSGIV